MPVPPSAAASTEAIDEPGDSASPALPALSRRAKLGLLGEVLGAYVAVRMRMRGRDIRQMVVQVRGDVRAERHTDPALARRLARAVSKTLNFLPTDSRCLARSLVLDRLLSSRSLDSVVIVAARSEPDFAAHAWVEHDGVPLLPPGTAAFKRMIEL